MSTSTTPLERAARKFWEADYFATLITGVCIGKKGLSPLQEIDIFPSGARPRSPRPIEDEISYLLSAFSNATYSVVEYLKRDKRFVEETKLFLATKKEFYGSGPTGGIRTRTVHFEQVVPNFEGCLKAPPSAAWDAFFSMLEEEGVPMTPVSGGWQPTTSFYLNDSQPQESIDNLCWAHIFEIKELLERCRQIHEASGT